MPHLMQMHIDEGCAVLLPGSQIQRRGNLVALQHAEQGD